MKKYIEVEVKIQTFREDVVCASTPGNVTGSDWSEGEPVTINSWNGL